MAVELDKVGARVYLVNLPFAAKDEAKRTLGMSGKNWDGERRQWWVGAAKLGEAMAFVDKINGASDGAAAEAAPPPTEDLDKCRVYAKVKYQGRTYFVIAETAGQVRCRLVTLDDGAVPFWVDCAVCELVKVYEGRENYRTHRVEYQTLGSMRRYVAEQRTAEKAGVPQCAACGKRGPLIEDLEDGCMKCRNCCDLPSE